MLLGIVLQRRSSPYYDADDTGGIVGLSSTSIWLPLFFLISGLYAMPGVGGFQALVRHAFASCAAILRSCHRPRAGRRRRVCDCVSTPGTFGRPMRMKPATTTRRSAGEDDGFDRGSCGTPVACRCSLAGTRWTPGRPGHHERRLVLVPLSVPSWAGRRSGRYVRPCPAAGYLPFSSAQYGAGDRTDRPTRPVAGSGRLSSSVSLSRSARPVSRSLRHGW